jgi:hypothetical protein
MMRNFTVSLDVSMNGLIFQECFSHHQSLALGRKLLSFFLSNLAEDVTHFGWNL